MLVSKIKSLPPVLWKICPIKKIVMKIGHLITVLSKHCVFLVMLAADTPENGWISVICVLIWVNGCIHFSATPKSEFRNSRSHYKENRKCLIKKGKSQNSTKQDRIDCFTWKRCTASSSPRAWPDENSSTVKAHHKRPGCVLNTDRLGASTICLGSLFQCLTTLSIK